MLLSFTYKLANITDLHCTYLFLFSNFLCLCNTYLKQVYFVIKFSVIWQLLLCDSVLNTFYFITVLISLYRSDSLQRQPFISLPLKSKKNIQLGNTSHILHSYLPSKSQKPTNLVHECIQQPLTPSPLKGQKRTNLGKQV